MTAAEEAFAPYPLGGQSQEPSLGVGQSQPSAAEVFPEDPVLGLQVFDRVLLAAVHPAGHGREEKSEVRRRAGAAAGLNAFPAQRSLDAGRRRSR